jgi:hypothetical protein
VVRFESLDEAIDFADVHFKVDFNDQKVNGAPMLFIRGAPGCKTIDESQAFTKVRLWLAGVFDLRAVPRTIGYTRLCMPWKVNTAPRQKTPMPSLPMLSWMMRQITG